ncbi:MAG: pectate lyase [Acidobacteria bacterium]|nr:pectate lyase [Acidobacteriota bacterium]
MKAILVCFPIFILTIATAVFGGAPDLVVAADGSGNVRTVGEAIAKVPENNRKRVTILIRKGTYFEQVNIPSSKPLITLIGESAAETKIAYSINNGSAGTTSAAYAFYVGGHSFRAENLTFENAFEYKPGTPGSQAVAVLAEADRLVFKNCRFLGWQDTLYAKNGRQYFENCYIEGNVDFIFGQAAAVFENSEIRSKGDGFIAAPMRFSADESSGFVFNRSKLTSNNGVKSVFLAHPWRAFGRAVFIDTEMGSHIRPEGWNNWGNPDNEKTAYFAEIRSSGPGATPEKRAAWARKLGVSDEKQFSTATFLGGRDGWNPKNSDDGFLENTPPDWKSVVWTEVLKQKPVWYQTDEAARIADQVVLFQKSNGGWEKNIDMTRVLTERERGQLTSTKDVVRETTIDNRTTFTQVAFLAKVVSGSLQKQTPPTNFPKHRDAFLAGLDFLLAMQYENGGFPQFFPLQRNYSRFITFNDDAMIGVLNVLRDIARRSPDYAFVDGNRRAACEAAVARAIPLILGLQVEIKGAKTVWAAQYDEKTLKPAAARKFEPASLTAGESVGIVRFLMGEANPSAEIVAAVDGAVKWYRESRIDGFRWEKVNGDRKLTKDPNSTLWARFYEFNTMRPIFVGRDAVIRYDVSEIESERRNGYAWYIDEPNELLDKDYPRWKKTLKR